MCDLLTVIVTTLPLYVACLSCGKSATPPPNPPDLPQPPTTCAGPYPTLVKLELPQDFLGLENVLRIEPSYMVLNRCSGLCGGGYHTQCQPVRESYRNLSVSVKYQDSEVCEDTMVQVVEVEECGCVCSSTPCPGMAVREGETCLCMCENTTQCGDNRHLSPHLCACQCNDNTPCWWKHQWSEQSCSCEIQITRSDIHYLIIFLLCLVLCLLAITTCYSRRQARQLQKVLDSNTTYGLSLNLLKQLVYIKPPKPNRIKTNNKTGYVVANGNVA